VIVETAAKPGRESDVERKDSVRARKALRRIMILFLKAFPDRVSKEFKKKKIQSTVPSE
jgi:hypothetical protein